MTKKNTYTVSVQLQGWLQHDVTISDCDTEEDAIRTAVDQAYDLNWGSEMTIEESVEATPVKVA
tara:strand:+ start:2623 stop:2814 length:192 start_codon:yes stop_codon:yes gene_type:complete